MHVLQVYKTFYTDGFAGVSQVMRQLGIGLVKRGVKVSVLTLSNKITAPTIGEHEGITIHSYPLTVDIASNGISLSAMQHYSSLAKTADILHYHFPWPSGDLLHQLAPKSIPSVVTYHSDIVRQRLLKIVYAPLMELFLRQMSAIVATSPNYIETSPLLKRFKKKTSCIPIGLNPEMYAAPTEVTLSKWRSQLPQKFFLFVGVLRYYKGLHTLIEAARLTGYPVMIVGAGPQAEMLKAQASGLTNVQFLGEVSDEDKVALLHLCQGFVFPSHLRSEAFGISLLEAAMMGKPMISCEIGSGMSYININNKTGFSTQPENPVEFADAMKRLHENPALREAFGKAARARYEELFTADIMVDKYQRLYQQLLSKALL